MRVCGREREGVEGIKSKIESAEGISIARAFVRRQFRERQRGGVGCVGFVGVGSVGVFEIPRRLGALFSLRIF